MYKIAILDGDKAYLERLVFFLKEHHGESFEISTANCLDNLDQEVTQYNALFFSDNVAVDAALFPAEIIVGYLTEKNENDGQYINKYQSMEQIYKWMIKLCATGERVDARDSETMAETKRQEEMAVESGDLKAETVTVDGETYRIYQIAEEQLDRLAIRMLAGNRIKGLFQTEYQNGGVRIRITGMKSLYEYIQMNNTPRGKERLLTFFGDMIATACSLEEYMLSADRLILDPREIYVNRTEDRVLISYMPIKSDTPHNTRQCLEKIQDLCSVLIEGISQKAAPVQKKRKASTDDSDSQQKSAQESQQLQEDTKTFRKGIIPYIVRKRTKERIIINRNLFKLGKDASYVDYCIKDNPAVSRNHADIVRKADGFYLIDKGSLNHTFVNGKKVVEGEYRKLEDGCLIQLANEVFEFKLR